MYPLKQQIFLTLVSNGRFPVWFDTERVIESCYLNVVLFVTDFIGVGLNKLPRSPGHSRLTWSVVNSKLKKLLMFFSFPDSFLNYASPRLFWLIKNSENR